MLWASFKVLNDFRHYVASALRPVFLVLTATIASVDESCVSRVVALISDGRGYYYDCLWLLDWHQMLWLILTRRIESWDLIHIRHVCQGYGLGACIYTPSFFISFLILRHVCQGYGLGVCICTLSFFTSFLIQNHSLHIFLGIFSSQKDISLFLLHSSKKAGEWGWSVVGVVPFWFA